MDASLRVPLSPMENLSPDIFFEIASCKSKTETSFDSQDDEEYTLSAEDLSNLRLVSKSICNAMGYSFGKRYFTTRKHMFSPHGLKALVEISRHPTLSKYVQKLIFGPETVMSVVLEPPTGYWRPPSMEVLESTENSTEKYDNWKSEMRKRRAELKKEQWDLECGTEGIFMLETALQNFKQLRSLRIEDFPHFPENGPVRIENFQPYSLQDMDPWTRPWGAKWILREMGIKETKVDVLVDPFTDGVRAFYTTILYALGTLKDRDNWTLDIHMSKRKLRFFDPPFDLCSRGWKVCCDRVRSVTVAPFPEPARARFNYIKYGPAAMDWMFKFFRSCRNLEVLSFGWDIWIDDFLMPQRWSKLRLLELCSCQTDDRQLQGFLKGHARSLQVIRLAQCQIEYRTQRKCVPWSEQLAIMADMPRLKEIRLSDLFQPKPIPLSPNVSRPSIREDGEHEMMAEGDEVGATLRQMVQQQRSAHAYIGTGGYKYFGGRLSGRTHTLRIVF